MIENMSLADVVFFVFLIVSINWGIKNNKLTILDVFIFVFSCCFWYFLSYVFQNKMLNALFPMHDSLAISILGVILLFGTFFLARYGVNKLRILINKK